MLIPSFHTAVFAIAASLSRRVNANSQHIRVTRQYQRKLIKKGEC